MKPKDFFNKQTTYSDEAEARAAYEYAKKLSEQERIKNEQAAAAD